MAITLNRKGISHAKALIAAGKINEGTWSFSAADGNALLGDNDWAEYGKWFLAVDSDADAETKEHYKYPFGKGGEIYRRGVIAAKQRASQQGQTAISEAADGLLEAIDKKLEKEEEKSRGTAERRFVPFAGEMRALKKDDGGMLIEGYPIVYGRYANLWGFKEIILAGAATEALERSSELVLWNHATDQPMAARKNGTLEVKEDEHGVWIRAEVSKTFWGRNGYEAIQNGLVDKMSFAFDIESDSWSWKDFDGVKIEVREIKKLAMIYDYSAVTFPAYEDTEVTARGRRLALRNRSEPGAPGEASTAVLEAREAALAGLRERRDHNLREEENCG